MSVPRERVLRATIASILFLANASAHGTTIAKVTLDDLFKQADLVAIVRILSGDAEHYPVTVYKAEVETAFKGTSAREKIYFGPCVSYGVGSEYLVFLKKSEEGIEPKDGPTGITYGKLLSFLRVMYDGYSVLPIEYACVFERDDVLPRCDYAVRLNPDQIILPAAMKVYPSGEADATTNYTKWTRKSGFVFLLVQMKKNQKDGPG